ncbi:MAG: hypothetical protein LBR48_01740 [Dysgonamonadaceae bacterium]|nr:hypothetical protein [Dysgonamonadaceae bacterium]
MSCNSKDANVYFAKFGATNVRFENHIPELDIYIKTYFAFCLKNTSSADEKNGFVYWKDDVLPDKAKDAEIFYIPGDGLSLEDRIRRMGHLFVKQINKLSRTPEQMLIHAAAVGIDNKGVLIAAKGGGGKSTLAVSAMLSGFQYVSDDYSIIAKNGAYLTAYPIYSTININPAMYPQMPGLQAKYLWNSWYNEEKHSVEISAHHGSFVPELDIKAIVYPQIAAIEKPYIEAINRDKVVVQVAYSTASQMGLLFDVEYINSLKEMISGMKYYQINLCPNLAANVELLKHFTEKL